MTTQEDTADLLDTLPYDLRTDVRHYVAAVDDSSLDIFEDGDVQLTEERRALFLYLVTLRKLWMTVDATVIAIRESMETLGRSGVAELEVGASRYGADTHDYRQLLDLRLQMLRALQREDLYPLIAFASLSELARATAHEQS